MMRRWAGPTLAPLAALLIALLGALPVAAQEPEPIPTPTPLPTDRAVSRNFVWNYTGASGITCDATCRSNLGRLSAAANYGDSASQWDEGILAGSRNWTGGGTYTKLVVRVRGTGTWNFGTGTAASTATYAGSFTAMSGQATYLLVDNITSSDTPATLYVYVQKTSSAGDLDQLHVLVRPSNEPTTALGAVVERGNPATGAPTITGTPVVGNALTANLGTIADGDGLPTAGFPSGYTFAWRSGSDIIAGATSRTYTVRSADVGKNISVRVGFTDQLGNPEARTSAATAAVTAAPAFSLDSLPLSGHTTTFKGLFTSGRTASLLIYESGSAGSLDAGTFAINGRTMTSIWQNLTDDSGPTNGRLRFNGPAGTAFNTYFQSSGAGTTQTLTILKEGSSVYSIAIADLTVRTASDELIVWGVPIETTNYLSSLTSGSKFIMALSTPPQAANRPATGTPTITGTAQVGSTLTANLGTIEDADGLPSGAFPSGYTFVWLRTGGVISGAVGRTYTPTGEDLGTTLSVRVAFTDQAGYKEARTSAATAAIKPVPNTPATGNPTVTGNAQVGHELTADLGTIADVNGLPATAFPSGYTFQWLRSTSTEIAGATARTYTVQSADTGATISVRVGFTDQAGNSESRTSGPTDAVIEASYDIPLPEVLYSGYDSLYVLSVPDNTPITAHCAGTQVGTRNGLGHLALSQEWVRGCYCQFKGRVFLPVLASDTVVGEPVVSEGVRFGFILAQWRGPLRDLADYIPAGVDHSFIAMFLVLLGGLVAASVVAGTIRKAGPVAVASAAGALLMVALTPAPIVLWLLIPAMTVAYLLLIRGGWQ